jgi:hypothetical protein
MGGLGRWRRRRRRGLRDHRARCRQQGARQKECMFHSHTGKTARPGGCSVRTSRDFRICDSGSGRNAPSAASGGARSG